MIEGAVNGSTFTVRHYKEEEGVAIIKEFIANFKKTQVA